jgi:hypothetical protein
MLPFLLPILLTQAPTIDGVVDAEEWAGALEPGPLLQQFPVEGVAASRPTHVRVKFDDDTLYFAFECDAPGDSIVSRLTRRDRESGSDFVAIDLDTRGDAQRAFHFEVSAAGVLRDAIRTGDASLDFDWDTVWRASAARSPTGWSVEVALPLTALRFEAGSEPSWRLQFRRFVADTNEVDAWALIPRSERGEMLRYRALPGLPHFAPSRGVVLRPFGLLRGRMMNAPGEAPRFDFVPGLGLDARLGVTTGLSLDAAVLPDFGQVEADRALLNLSTFEFRFPEKRPFFIEGADLFALKDVNGDPLSTQLFYSRRLGAPVAYETPEGSTAVSVPDVNRIWGAAKLSGRFGDGWTVALLDGVSAAESAVIADASGARQKVPLSVTTNFAAGRLARTLPGGFTLAASAADVRRFEPRGALLLADGTCSATGESPSPDGRCTHDATSGALDAAWRSPDGDWSSTAAVMLSARQAGPTATLRDGTTLGAGDVGVGTRLEAAKVGGTVVGDVVFESYSPRFDVNDSGYVASQNLHRLFTQVGFKVLDVGPARETRTTVELFGRSSWDGVPIARGVQVNNLTTWHNFWQSWLELQLFPNRFDNRETHDGARYERPPQLGVEWWLTTNPAQTLVFESEGLFHTTWRGVSVEASASVSLRPRGSWQFSLEPTLVRVTGDPRWVDTAANGVARDYRFGVQDALAVGGTLRASWTLTPTLGLQAYAQLFFADVRYGTILHSGPSSSTNAWLPLSGLSELTAAPGTYDEREAVFNANVVFRWEWLPGSVLFLVYSHGQGGAPATDGARVRPRLDLASVGRMPSSDVLMVKLTYYFSR